MFPLGRQVQIAADIARKGAARLAGLEAPPVEDNETTFAELITRLKNTIAYLKTFEPTQIDGSEEKLISLPLRDRTIDFDGLSYLLYFVQPNVYFHVTTTYNILRHCGVALGKLDFLGKP